MFTLAEWQPLFSVQAGAAATLTGLVFVAVSINIKQIMEVQGLPGRAAESIVQLLGIFFVSSLALIPRQTYARFGMEVLAIAAISWVTQVTGQIRYARKRAGHPWSWLMTRTVMTQCATVPFFIAAVLLLRGDVRGLYWLVLGVVFSFVAAVASAWVLLVEILR